MFFQPPTFSPDEHGEDQVDSTTTLLQTRGTKGCRLEGNTSPVRSLQLVQLSVKLWIWVLDVCWVVFFFVLQTSLSSLIRSSVPVLLSRAWPTWWNWRKEATLTQTPASSISSRTVIPKSSPGCPSGSTEKTPAMPECLFDMQNLRGQSAWTFIVFFNFGV